MKDYAIQLDNETFDLQADVKRGDDNLITQGIVAGNTLSQNQTLILKAYPGEWKENPVFGVGFDDALFSNDTLVIRHNIRRQMQSDGMIVSTLTMNETEFELEAQYE